MLTHSSAPIIIFHYDKNDSDHLISISDTGELIEFSFCIETEEVKMIDKCQLHRPNDELLVKNGHNIVRVNKWKNNRNNSNVDYINKIINFENYICLGYADGLILIYQIIQQENNDSVINENEENEEEIQVLKSYTNIFSLYYILLGHTKAITALFYLKEKKMLVTASENYSCRIYDMETGKALFDYSFDCIFKEITYVENKSNKLLILLSDEPYKLIMDMNKEPYNFNNFSFLF